MNILFDYQMFELQSHGGISRFYAESFAELDALGVECIIGVKRSDNIHLRQTMRHLKPAHYFGKRTLERRFPKLTRAIGLNDANRQYCIKLLNEGHFDIFEPTYYDSYFLPLLKVKPFTLQIHDMIPELFPHYFPPDDFQIIQKRTLAPLAAHIIVPSQRTKDDVINILDINPDKITVISRGIPKLPQSSTPRAARFPRAVINQPPPPPYLLFVGERTNYKNFSPLLREFAILAQREKDLQLVCTAKPFNDAELQLLAQLGLSQRVVHQFVSDTEMYSLYNNALAFVFPSAYEGFGLPILEAFSSGCPVMLNNASCFPEIGGDAAIYFDINQEGDFCSKFNDMLSRRNELINKGLDRAKQFSWQKTINRLIAVYSNI